MDQGSQVSANDAETQDNDASTDRLIVTPISTNVPCTTGSQIVPPTPTRAPCGKHGDTKGAETSVEIVNLEKKFQETLGLFVSLDCTVCFDHLCAPISQCSNGHLICEDCKTRIPDMPRKCPTCRDELGEIRNLLAESIAEKMKFPCKWNFMGCDGVFSSPGRRIHEHNCKFRPFNCNVCPWAGKEDEIFPHMKNEHHFTELLDGDPLKNNENFGTYFLLMADQPSGCGHYAVVDGVKILVYVKMDEDMLMVSIRHAGAGRPGRYKVSVKLKDDFTDKEVAHCIKGKDAVKGIKEYLRKADEDKKGLAGMSDSQVSLMSFVTIFAPASQDE